ncbi:ROK family protein, partial [bacterium]|nr:ROK family protein [bacterium]
IGLAGLVNIFNPEIIVIGGGISAAGDFIITPLKRELYKRAFRQYLRSLDIRIAELGNRAGIVGAAAMVNGS